MSIDPTGPLIVFLAADPGVTSPVHGQKKQGEDPPYVIVRRRTSRRAFSGPESHRMGVQSIDYVAFCYARKQQSGYRDAYRLAGAVSAALHQKGPLSLPAPGGSGRVGVYQIDEQSTGDALTDPLTDEPYVPLFFGVLVAADAMA